MQFRKITLEDRKLYLKYLKEYKFETYEYSFTTLYLWRHYLNVEIACNDIYDCIVIKKKCSSIGSYFNEPVGYKDNDLKDIVIKLNNIKRENHMDFLFRDIEEPFLCRLIEIFGKDIQYEEDRNNFDYTYNTVDLAEFKGIKYKKRRNRYNDFVNKYAGFEIKICDKEEILKNECLKLADYWYESREENKTEETYYELKGIKDLLDNYKFLNLKFIKVYYDKKLIGFAIGEKINKILALIHVEKCIKEYKGIYEFINRTFVKKCFSDTLFINRGEDLGDAGLREAKKGYNPVKLVKKYIVNLKF